MIATSSNQAASSTSSGGATGGGGAGAASGDAPIRVSSSSSSSKSHDDGDVKYFFQRPDQMQDPGAPLGVNSNGARTLSKWGGDDTLLLEQVVGKFEPR